MQPAEFCKCPEAAACEQIGQLFRDVRNRLSLPEGPVVF